MKIDFEEIERTTGRKFESIEQLYFYIVRSVEFLYVHNKNYNKKQYERIYEFLNFINAIKFDEK